MGYTDEKIVFNSEVELSGNTFEVRSTVEKNAGNVPIYYRVILKDGSWRVYDVVIEGVSLINNYRSQFKEILAKNPPESLLETLRKKVVKS
jgi:phospholipid transport system substrate-binding protein